MCESLESRLLLSADSLDNTFGTGGRAVTDFTDLSGSDDIVTAVRSLSDGKTLVAGNDNAGISWVSRYTATGQLDSTFGVGGKLATSLLIRANDVQVVSGGGILLAGEGFNGNNFDLAVLKLTSTGDVDETFGNRGLALANFFNLTDTAHSIAIQSDGKILAAGSANNAGQLDFAIARFNPDGTLDITYDADGKQTVEFTNAQNNEARDVKLDPTSGKAVVSGFAFNGGDHNFAIARLTTQGGLDTTFDTDGKVTTDFNGGGNSDDRANSVVVSSTGIITAGGFATRADGKFDFALAQYNSNGTLRSGFDTDGRVTTDFTRGTPSNDKIGEIKLDSSGNIVAAGGTFEAGIPPREDFAMARYSANGAIDQTLGDGGLIYASFYANLGDQATALDIDSLGRWVVGGFTYNEFKNFAIGRFGESKPTGTAGDDAFVLTYAGTAPSGSVTVTLSSSGGPVTTLGTFPLTSPLTIDGLGGTDSVRVVGTSGNDTLTVNSSTGLTINGAGIVLTSIESRVLDGTLGNDVYTFDGDAALGLWTLDEAGGGLDTIDLSLTTTVGLSLNLGSPSIQVVHATNLSLILGSATTFENVTGGALSDTLTGNGLTNTLIGGAGNDSMTGAGGSDTLIGGLNDDTYFFAATTSAEGDQVFENVSQGLDTLNFSAMTTSVIASLGTNAVQSVHLNRTVKLNTNNTFEHLVGGTSNDILTGNSLGNTLSGGKGHNVLVGLDGSDILIGDTGRDILIGGLGLDNLNGGGGDDILIAGRTKNDSNAANLNTIRTQWISGNSYALRIANLRAGVGSPAVSLKTKINVLNDAGEDDSLTGGANLDWYFRAVDDVISDLFAGEIIDVL
jgi:uncharacterized delta-60 repeat protein